MGPQRSIFGPLMWFDFLWSEFKSEQSNILWACGVNIFAERATFEMLVFCLLWTMLHFCIYLKTQLRDSYVVKLQAFMYIFYSSPCFFYFCRCCLRGVMSSEFVNIWFRLNHWFQLKKMGECQFVQNLVINRSSWQT